MSGLHRLTIIQREIPHYRIAFFGALQREAQRHGLHLTVYSGTRFDQTVALPFAHRTLPMRYLLGSASGPCWLTGLAGELSGSDIVVAPHELQCLTVPALWLCRHRLTKFWIWWGHGYNFQSSQRSSLGATIASWVKDQLVTKGHDGLITYTYRGTEYWCNRGLPAQQVMPFLNTIDVEGLWQVGREVTETSIREMKLRLGLDGKQILLFSGRLYAEKEVEFLLRAYAMVRQAHPNTALLILGDGVERRGLEALAEELGVSGVHFLGEVLDPRESSLYFKVADVLVIPGLVGLAIVHGFAFGVPLITTERDFHSPEIEYLSQRNGLMTVHEPKAYAHEIVRLLSSPQDLERLRTGCMQSAQQLTLSASANRFIRAVLQLSNASRSGDRHTVAWQAHSAGPRI
ncbi:MAG: glycosyltransferase family 4 protein [Nitrospiraceae bacterium]|nr:glycosyltransferase family 4 protein [Nitrospiraceae bacterium]